jgi:hypothetical protein
MPFGFGGGVKRRSPRKPFFGVLFFAAFFG